jgi:CDP-diacylglycerol pyrophosphatase
MMMRTWRLGAAICSVWSFALAGCAPSDVGLPPAPVHANGQVLWKIVNDRCIPGQLAHASPAPCAEIAIGAGVARGYAVLKDRNGASQYLVMPTIRITGIEDPRLLAPDAVDYFTPAWHARRLVEQRLGTSLSREDVSIAINSIYGRSQDLLHLHVDCVRADVRDALRTALPAIGHDWSRHLLKLAGHGYHAVRIDGDEGVAPSPFLLLAQGLHVAPADMGAWTIVLVGATFADGQKGFVLLAARADPSAGYDGSGERLQDHDCAVAAPH